MFIIGKDSAFFFSEMFSSDYCVCRSLASIAAWNRLCILLMSLRVACCVLRKFHSSSKASLSFGIPGGWKCLAKIALWSISHKWSTTLVWGPRRPVHSKNVFLYFSVNLARCGRAFLTHKYEIKTNCSCIWPNISVKDTITIYFSGYSTVFNYVLDPFSLLGDTRPHHQWHPPCHEGHVPRCI